MKKWKCTVCGKVFEGDAPPAPCPVCGAGEEAFVLLEATLPTRWRCSVCGKIFEGETPPVPCPVCGAGREAFEAIETEKTYYKKDTEDKFVLIGGGVAAVEAAKAIRQRNKTARVTIVSGEDHYPYNRPALSDVVADGLSFANLLLEEEAFYADSHLEVKMGREVVAVDTAKKVVRLADGEELPYTRLLLAMGAVPFNPIQRQDGAIPVGVLRCFEDAMALAENARGKRVVLVGGGILGLEAAVALREIGCFVTVVEFAPRILPLQTDEEVSRMLAAKLEALGVRLMCGMSVTAATPHGVVLKDGAELAAEYVLASMGVRSNVALAQALGLVVERGIVVDEYMRTSMPDVWAAGDCAEFDGRVQAMMGAASSMGSVAGAAMAGDERVPYTPFVPATFFECPGFSLFSVGAAKEDAQETAVYRNEHTGAYRRLFFENGKLTGALFVGKNPGAKALAALVAGLPPEEAVQLLV